MTFETCRTLGHAWEIKAVRDTVAVRVLTLRCSRCSTERNDYVAEHGRLTSRIYGYVDGYRTTKGDRLPTRNEFRAALIASLLKARK